MLVIYYLVHTMGIVNDVTLVQSFAIGLGFVPQFAVPRSIALGRA